MFLFRGDNTDLLRRLNDADADEPDQNERWILDAVLAAHANRLQKEQW